MRKYNYAEIDKYVQWLMKMMSEEYPNNYELVITSDFAEIKNTQSEMNFLSDKLKNSEEPLLAKYMKEFGGNIKVD